MQIPTLMQPNLFSLNPKNISKNQINYSRNGVHFAGMPVGKPLLPLKLQSKIDRYVKSYNSPAKRKPFQWHLKQVIDKVGSAFALAALTPVLLASAVALKMESKGPVLFKQTRIGLNGKPFEMYKFRTMDKSIKAAAGFKKGDFDPRVTRVGRFLRRTSIDEMPQLFNVLEGTMSLTGPRPYIPQDVAKMSKRSMKRYVVKPGIALASYYHKNKAFHPSIAEKVPYETKWFKNWNLGLDFKVMKAYFSDMIHSHNS